MSHGRNFQNFQVAPHGSAILTEEVDKILQIPSTFSSRPSGCPARERDVDRRSYRCPPKSFFRESRPQISNGKGCPLKMLQRSKFSNLKSQGVSLFKESSPQISNRKRVPLRFFQSIKPLNFKSQGVSLDDFSENPVHKFQAAKGIPLRFFRESSHQISNCKGCRPKIFHRFKSPNGGPILLRLKFVFFILVWL